MIRYEAETRLAVPVRLAWEIAANTDALDAAAGMPTIEYRDEAQPNGTSRRFFEYRLKGLRVVGEELPFDWEFPRRYSVDRTYSVGPFTATTHLCELEPVDAGDPSRGTVVRNVYEFTPRGLFGKIFSRGFQKQVMPLLDRWMIERADELVAALSLGANPDGTATDIVPTLRRPGDDFGPAATRSQKETLARLMETARLLSDVPEMDLLEALLRDGSEYDVARLRPYALARAWDGEPRGALRACLAATKVGVLALRWDVICPHCRGDKQHLENLLQVKPASYCPACNVDFDVDLDRSLEAVFVPHRQVRDAPGPKYCLGGPGATPHIFHQKMVGAGETYRPVLELPPGTYRLRASGIGAFRWVHVRDNMEELQTTSGEFSELASQRMSAVDGDIDILPESLDGPDPIVAPWTPTSLPVHNRTEEPRLVIIESVEWAADSLQAGELVADHEFRDLFSSQMLTEGVSLAVESVTILFTDLVGSTAMYSALGDARAFNLVWAHFDLLVEIVKGHRGAIVKTIGDAIMAAFARPADAVLASLALQEEMAAHVQAAGHDYPVGLKVGMHAGPCIVVTLNERLDYFGTTVNLAARTEAQSDGGDIVMTASTLATADGADAILRAAGYSPEPFDGVAKGFAAPIPMVRWTR